jgi:hypothetical protein
VQPIHHGFDRLGQLPLRRLGVELDGHDALHLELVVVAGRVQFRSQVVDQMRVGHVRQLGGRVVHLERRQDLLGVVHKVEHVRLVLAGVRAVQSRQGLHRLDARQPLVDVHPAQERLVEAGLKLVRHQSTP